MGGGEGGRWIERAQQKSITTKRKVQTDLEQCSGDLARPQERAAGRGRGRLGVTPHSLTDLPWLHNTGFLGKNRGSYVLLWPLTCHPGSVNKL